MTADPPQDEWPRPSQRFLEGMALSQTPRQQQLARQIYARLLAGAEVDDVKDLIDRMVRTVAQERHPDQDIAESSDHSRTSRHVLRFDLDEGDQ